MKDTEPQPLWREVVGNREPWRRGRLLLIGFAALMLAGQSYLFFSAISVGAIEVILGLGVNAVFFWLQFYFIWIGVHWVRWLLGGWNLLAGFCLLIWGWRDSNGVQAVAGILTFVVGVYLCLSPSIYFFAVRQKERRRRLESAVVAFMSLFILASLGIGTFGVFAYKEQLQTDAHEFADDAFEHIFAKHDTYFLMDHVSDQLMKMGGGQMRLTQFLQDATIRAGDVSKIKPAVGGLYLRYGFPARLGSGGAMATEGTGTNGPVEMYLRLIQSDRGWQIDAVSCVTRPRTLSADLSRFVHTLSRKV